MPLWGNKNQPVTANLTTTHESTQGAPIGTYVHVKGDQMDRRGGANAHAGNTVPGSRCRVDSDMFESAGFNEFMPKMAVGVFGVYANSGDLKTELNEDYHEYVNTIHARKKYIKRTGVEPDGEQVKYRIVDPGCGYPGGKTGTPVPVTLYYANGLVVTDAVQGDVYYKNVMSPPDPKNGKVLGFTVLNEQFVYEAPNADIAPPEEFFIGCNSSQIDSQGFILDFPQAYYGIGDKLFYYVPSGNTPVAPLTGNTYYYVANVGFTHVQFSETLGGEPIILTDPRMNSDDPVPEQHEIQGQQAQIEAYIEEANSVGASHAGWVLRKAFRGGRDGRVQTECLVAMSSLEQGVIPPREPEPVVYDISPDFGSEFGGDTVTIVGENFISFDPGDPMKHVGDTFATRVLFGNVFANDVSIIVANNTYLTVTSPPSPKPQTVDVRVQTGYGISRVNPNAKFTYFPTDPYIKRITPNKGGYKGQTNVVIWGYNFESATRVQFDTTDALSFEVVSNEYIKAVTPPHANGTINVFITGANGTSDPDPTSEFTYYSAVPTISGINPANGSMAPTQVTIKGSNFIQYGAKYKGDTTVLDVFFGQQYANIVSIVSDSSIVVVPPVVLTPGTVDVTVRNTYGNSIPDANSKFTYYADPPTLDYCTPNTASCYIPTKITVTGNNLWLANLVQYDVQYIRSGIQVSPDGKTLVFTTAANSAEGYKQIQVTTPSGTSPLNYSAGIAFTKIPYIQTNDKQTFDYRGNTTCNITGLNFNAPGYQIITDGYYQLEGSQFSKKIPVANLNVINNTALNFKIPNFYNYGASFDTYYTLFLVANNSAQSTPTSASRVFVANWTPTLDKVDPDIGPIKGYTDVYCYGKNYSQSAIKQVFFGEDYTANAIVAKSFRVVNDSLIIAVAPTVTANLISNVAVHVIVQSNTCGNSYLSVNNEFFWTNNSGTLQSLTLNYPGTGYNNNHPPIKITARLFTNGMMDSRAGTANAGTYANVSGRIITVNANNNFPILFRGFANTPVFEVDPPEKYSFPANTTGFAGYPASTRKWALYGATSIFQQGDRVLYTCEGPGGPLKPLQNQTYYYVTQLETSWPVSYFQLSTNKADAMANICISIFDTRLNSNQATNDISFVQGDTANVNYTLVP